MECDWWWVHVSDPDRPPGYNEIGIALIDVPRASEYQALCVRATECGIVGTRSFTGPFPHEDFADLLPVEADRNRLLTTAEERERVGA